jgi:hypothetical protein
VAITQNRGRFDALREELDDRIERGETFESTEDWIDGQQLGNDHKAALWLWAWTHLPSERQQSLCHEYIENLDD